MTALRQPFRVPVATYRLQFNSGFTFRDATGIIDYLHRLGISDCYASSYLKAVPDSPHGYDVADPTRLNPEIGTDEEYWAWIAAMQARGMGHVLDLVPNHMGIARSSNPWWLDVLENGPSSRFARFFDIEWRPVKDELADKVLIPILGDQYGAVLERQELQLAYRDGAFFVRYYEDVLPIAPDTYGEILRASLDEWLERRPRDGAAGSDSDAEELLSIITACENLPPRASRDADQIAVRAREKEVVKRRLGALSDRSADVRELIAAAVDMFNGVAGEPRSFDTLDRLLNAQSYRLAHWRVASEEINYRRFFDVNQLAALRMEDPAVFEEVHRFVFELVARGAATGLRVDHVDGLYDPGDYLQRLQTRDTPVYVVVEKILGPDEQLPAEWPVHGTTGYEFAAVVNQLFVDSRNERAFDDIYLRFIRERRGRLSFPDIAYDCKKHILHETMSGDINSIGHQLNRFSERNRHYRDFTLYSLISTIKEIIACFPVYRTYITPDAPISAHDRRYVDAAVRCAKRRSQRTMTSVVFDFVERVLLKKTAVASREACEEQARFIGKFQQITSPIAAKGIEDTAFYRYNRLLSLNEVGGDPTRFGMSPEAVHAWMIDRQRRWPLALSPTSTHDTKRGEDVRARLNVLSEIPGAWKAAVSKWRALNRRHKVTVRAATVPDANEEYHLYQTLVGAWPFQHDHAAFVERIRAYMIKALREAKTHTSWLSPDEDYEQGVLAFVQAILDRRRANPFMQAFLPFQARVAELGIYASLAQLLIKITAPGVPDFYQGTELWDLNLVDPDNRRRVDYERRRTSFASDPAELLEHRADGRIKLFAIARALEARAKLRDVYERGEYIPVESAGTRRDSVFAFARRYEDTIAITCVPRLVASLIPDAAGPPLGPVWADTRIELSGSLRSAAGRTFVDAFTGATMTAGDDGSLSAPAVFDRFPIALLIPADASRARHAPA